VADTFRRRVHEMYDTFVSMYQTYLCDKILEVSKSDVCYMDISVNFQKDTS
jgi:hypothetical protein